MSQTMTMHLVSLFHMVIWFRNMVKNTQQGFKCKEKPNIYIHTYASYNHGLFMMIVLFCGLKPSKSTQQTAFRRFAALRGAALGGAQTKSSPPGTAATLQQHESWEQQDMEFLHGVGVNMGFTIKFNGLTIKQMFDY